MNTQILVLILGMYMIVSGLTMLLRRKTFPLIIRDLFEHRAIMWVVGFILMLLGGVIALQPAPTAWVTAIGWLILIKGAIYIFAPEFYSYLFKNGGRYGVFISGCVVTAIGMYLVAYSML